MLRILCVAGARPNFMKLAPLFRQFSQHESIQPVLVHTGQHYDERMSGSFFRDLEIPLPSYNLEVGSGSHATQTAEIMRRLEPVVLKEQPDAVLVVGDVNSTSAAAIVAKKLNIQVIHVEAGLRSFDRSMPEEINRLITDAISDVLLVTEESGSVNLRNEGIPEHRIHFVGNLMIDSLLFYLEKARNSPFLKDLGLEGLTYGLVTLHRPSNVDDDAQIATIFRTLDVIAKDLPLYFPVHPRTRMRMRSIGIAISDKIHLLEPLGYLDFICLMSNSAAVLTDSGGIQEETTALRIPCLTLRSSTERPITVQHGTNILAGTTSDSILSAWHLVKAGSRKGVIPKFWDGRAAERAVSVLKQSLSNNETHSSLSYLQSRC
jgi:UDP-N-acetylglucosamine 2-epimerase (non-hydrolysing)